MAVADLCADFELLLGLELCSSGTDDVESSGVAVLVDKLVSHDDVLVLEDSAGSSDESVELVLRVCLHKCVIEAADDIVSAGRLSA